MKCGEIQAALLGILINAEPKLGLRESMDFNEEIDYSTTVSS